MRTYVDDIVVDTCKWRDRWYDRLTTVESQAGRKATLHCEKAEKVALDILLEYEMRQENEQESETCEWS